MGTSDERCAAAMARRTAGSPDRTPGAGTSDDERSVYRCTGEDMAAGVCLATVSPGDVVVVVDMGSGETIAGASADDPTTREHPLCGVVAERSGSGHGSTVVIDWLVRDDDGVAVDSARRQHVARTRYDQA